MQQITKSIRIIIAGLACLWPLVFFAGLPAAASVLSTDSVASTPVQAVAAMSEHQSGSLQGQNLFQRHEPSFFLDEEPAGSTVVDLSGGTAAAESAVNLAPSSLGSVAIIAVLLLAAFNARKRRSRTNLAQG